MSIWAWHGEQDRKISKDNGCFYDNLFHHGNRPDVLDKSYHSQRQRPYQK